GWATSSSTRPPTISAFRRGRGRAAGGLAHRFGAGLSVAAGADHRYHRCGLGDGFARSIARPVAFGTPWSAIHRGKPVGRGYHSWRCRGHTLTSRRLHALPPLDFARDHPELVRQAAIQHRTRHLADRFALPGELRDGGESIASGDVGCRVHRLRQSKPGKGQYIGSQGVGSIGHLAGELFKSMTGIDMVHVPYRSVALALADVINGQIHVQFATSTDSIPQIRGGQVRALAVSSATRLPALPDVPTVAEYLPDYAFESWLGIAGPKNLPAEIVGVLNREINASLARAEIKAKYEDL